MRVELKGYGMGDCDGRRVDYQRKVDCMVVVVEGSMVDKIIWLGLKPYISSGLWLFPFVIRPVRVVSSPSKAIDPMNWCYTTLKCTEFPANEGWRKLD